MAGGLQVITFPTPATTGDTNIIFSGDSEYFYLPASSYLGNIRLQLSSNSDYFYTRGKIGHINFGIITQADYFYEKNSDRKINLLLSLSSDTLYISPKIGHLNLRFELDSLYTMHGLPITGKVKIKLYPIADYIFTPGLIGKTKVSFNTLSDCYYLDAYRYIGRNKLSLNLNSDYVYSLPLQSKIIGRFSLNSDTSYGDADNLFRAYIFGIKPKFKIESNTTYINGTINPLDLIPDENDLRYLQSYVDFIYDINILDTSDAVNILVPLNCVIDNPDAVLVEITLTSTIRNPRCCDDIQLTANVIHDPWESYLKIVQEPNILVSDWS